MQRTIRYLTSRSRAVYGGVAALLAIVFLLLFRLGSLTTNLSGSELKQQVFSSSWRHLSDNPLNLPYTGLQWLVLQLFSHHGSTVTRLPSVIIGLVGLLAFSYIIRRWYGTKTALYGMVLFATSAWFLHVSRFGGPEVLYLAAAPTLLAVQLFWERHAQLPWISWVSVAIIGLLLYVPGMVWLVLLSITLHPGQLLRSWRHTRTWWQWAILVVVVGLFITPLVHAFVKDSSLIQTWVGLPQHYATVGHIGRQLLHSFSFLGYRGPSDPQLWLDRVPVLDVFSLVMLVLGVLFYARHAKAPRARQLIGLWLVGAVLFALGGPVGYSLLVPIAYLFVTGGIGYLLHEWLHVFPKNALARAVGYSLLALVVATACLYQLRSYFIAWPHSLPTIATYQIPPK